MSDSMSGEMPHHDLGVLDGPVLLFGGPYSNLQALNAVLSAAAARGIAGDHMICTGDLVAYCGSPVEVTRLIRHLGVPVVAGNCEVQLGQGAPDCGCGFEEGSACDMLSGHWYSHASAALTQDDKVWMSRLPRTLSFHHQGERYGVIHGGVRDIARFIWPNDPPEVFAEEWEAVVQAIGPVDHIIAGHCGIPFVKDTAKGQWINAGVIGMPPHDGCQQTRYAILDGGAAQIMRLTYDAPGAADAMAAAGLPDGYRSGLIKGYWPSEDVLPPALRVPSLASG
ncbi:MAG: metallophosphoesterase [Sulfitobacter sp.]